MPDYILLIIVLAAVSTAGYFRGRKKNRWIAGWISRETEDVLKPDHTSYTNIGGTIGYNFTFALTPPLKEAKGTFTLLPRQSILYLPVSLIITRHDRYYLHIYAAKKLMGEGHLIRKDYFRRMRTSIAGAEAMEKETLVQKGREYILLTKEVSVKGPLKKLLSTLDQPDHLMHFCCYPDTKVFFVYMKPVKGQTGAVLKHISQALPSFIIAKGVSNGTK